MVLLQEFDEEINGEKIEQHSGAVNDFHSSTSRRGGTECCGSQKG